MPRQGSSSTSPRSLEGCRGSECVPALVTAPAVPPPLQSKARGQVKHRRGEGKLCHGGVTVDTPGQSRPQVLSGWAPPGEPRGGCEAPANPNPGRKIVHHPQATLPKEPGATQGSFPAHWGQPRARWAELSWQSQSNQDSLPFPNPVCSDKKPKRRAKKKRMKREKNDLEALCQQLLPLGDEGLPLLGLWPRAGVAQAPQHPLVAGAVAGPRGEDIVSPRGGRLLHPHHQPLLILLG